MPETILDRLETVVARHAERIAVRYGSREQTFAALSSRADSIVQALHAAGVRAGDRVAVCLEPELDVPAVVIGVLRSGAIYVPIDPEYPRARVDAILSDIGPRVLVSRAAILERVGPATEVTRLLLEGVGELAPSAPQVPVGPDDAATIFHTSGTTGRPKGAVASHRNVAYYAESARDRYGYAPGDVIPTIARFSFSISIFELLVPLSAGATVLVLDRATVMDPERLAAALEDVTCFHAGPSLLRALLRHLATRSDLAQRYARIRHASSGGDMIPPQVLSDLRQVFPQAEIFVIYGCTEISCMGCTDAVPGSGPIARTYVGLPFDGTTTRLVGEDGDDVAPGEIGEVWFAGPGVVSGYWQREDAERDRFIDHGDRRWYRTGDLARWWEGRGLELLGRSDFQVKVRGQRVEAAEVEFHLRETPGIRDAAVVMRSLRGESVLTAFVVRDADAETASLDGSELAARARRRLSDLLPDYMVPAVLVELPRLPLNHNLKLDRRALPELSEQPTALDAASTLQGATERWLAELWQAVLSRDVVSRRHNFFELGGDSLSAQQVILRVQEQRGVELDGMALLREPLWVLAQLIAPDEAHATPPVPPTRLRVAAFHFGAGRELYGLLTSPPAGKPRRAALICQPIGADNVRSSFVLTLLAQRLAERGIPAMRFDFFGTRDSLGDGHDGTLARWRADVADAHRELRARTDATDIIGIGVRLGAAMMLDASATLAFERLIVWDPVVDGREFVDAAAVRHRDRVLARLPRFPLRTPRQVPGRRELLGFTWSTTALEELGRYRAPAFDRPAPAPISWLASTESPRQPQPVREVGDLAAVADLRTLPASIVWTEKTLELLPESGVVTAMLEAIP